MLKKLIVLLLMMSSSFVSVGTLAQDSDEKPVETSGYQELQSNTKNADFPSSNESWYSYWGLGASKISYDDDTQKSADELKALPGVEHMSLAFDLLGFYFPIHNHNLILGGVINIALDNYEVNTGVELDITQTTYSFSLMKFFGQNVGDGIFLRSDVGLAKFDATVKGNGVTATGSSDTGIGLLIGGGYAVPVSDGARVLFNLNYAYRKVKSDKVGTTALTVGILF